MNETDAGTFGLRCADGGTHAEHGEVLTTGDFGEAFTAGLFMDEDLDDSPWTCGPHTAIELTPEFRLGMDGLGNIWRHYHDVGWLRLMVTAEPGVKALADVEREHGPLTPLVTA